METGWLAIYEPLPITRLLAAHQARLGELWDATGISEIVIQPELGDTDVLKGSLPTFANSLFFPMMKRTPHQVT